MEAIDRIGFEKTGASSCSVAGTGTVCAGASFDEYEHTGREAGRQFSGVRSAHPRHAAVPEVHCRAGAREVRRRRRRHRRRGRLLAGDGHCRNTSQRTGSGHRAVHRRARHRAAHRQRAVQRDGRRRRVARRRLGERHGLYSRLCDVQTELDAHLDSFARTLARSNPEAMAELKKTFWAGTEHWDELLPERAKMSGRLVLSDFTKRAVEQFKARR